MGYSLYELIVNAGLNTYDVISVRHSLTGNDKCLKDSYNKGFYVFEEYQKIQRPKDFFKCRKYILSFVSIPTEPETGANTLFVGLYEDKGIIGHPDRLPEFPRQDYYDLVENPNEPDYYHNLVRCDMFSDIAHKMKVIWKSPVSYRQVSEKALRNNMIVEFPEELEQEYFK